MTSLFSRLQKLRDFLVERDRRLYTRGQALTADDLSAVLNLIEAAQQALDETNVPGDELGIEFIRRLSRVQNLLRDPVAVFAEES